MKFYAALFATAALLAATPALADDALAIKTNALVKTADGARVGRIDRVVNDADGKPVAVKIIFQGRFITIPAASLSTSGQNLVTTLSRKDVDKL